MQNLKKPLLNKVWYDKVVAAKTTPAVVLRLRRLQSSINKWYKSYCADAKAGRIDNYNLTSTLAVDRQDLQDCYDQSATVVKLKEYIRNRQDKHVRHICQYCMVGISDTFDHYLPQTPFPEFSILSNNLLPACDNCNRKKWQHWKNAAGERIILNFYYDAIPTEQFLFCSVNITAGVPVATFSYQNINGIPVGIYNHIVRHFRQLEVIERIHSVCDSHIETVGIELSGLLATHKLATVSAFLQGQANELKKKFGNNYCWAILKEAMANNSDYLNLIGFV